MRKVKFVTHGYFGGKEIGPIKEGWFHGFFQEGNNEGGIDPVAVVETLIGECVSIGVKQIKFESQSAESESAVGPALHTTGDKSLPADICADCVTEPCDSRGTGVVECTGKLCG